jgi:membrane protein
MTSSGIFHHWLLRLDRERARTFLHFLLRRFLDDNCLQSAGALSFTTIFALVPLTATVLGVVSMFPVSQQWGDQLTAFIFSNFVPQAAHAVADYLHDFASSARLMTGLGAAGVLLSSLLMMWSIEDAFNRIWRVVVPRRPLARFGIYWVALTLGPLLSVLSLAISSYFFSLPFLAGAEQRVMLKYVLGLTPVLMELTAFTAAYSFIPNRRVGLRFAFAGGVLATLLFELAKFTIAFYLTRASYQQIYGALAMIPILMFWIWISWLVILLGATLAASLSAFRYQPASLRLPPGYEIYALLRLLGRFLEARGRGRGVHSEELHQLEPMLTDDLQQRLLGALCGIDVIQRNAAGEWLLSRDLDQVPMSELYEAAGLRVPIGDAALPCSEDALGRDAKTALDALRLPLREELKHDVGSIFRKHLENREDTPVCTPPSA